MTCVQAKELPLGTVPPGASLVYAIELVSLEKVRIGAHAGALHAFNINNLQSFGAIQPRQTDHILFTTLQLARRRKLIA